MEKIINRSIALWIVTVLASCGLFESDDSSSGSAPEPGEVAANQPQPTPSPQPAQPAAPNTASPQGQQPQNNTGGDANQNQGIQVPGMPGVNLPNPFPANNQGGNQPNGNSSGNTNDGNTNNNNKGLQIPGIPGLKLPFPTSGTGDGGDSGNTRSDPQPPARGSLSPAPMGSFDGEGLMASAFIRSRTTAIHSTLIAALPERERNLMSSVPFEIANEAREPNAAAVCTKRSRRPFMVITTAMLVVVAGIAETKSYDEVANTNFFDSYIDAVVRQVRARRPVGAVPRGLLTGPATTDQHKLARQVHLFDQQVGFIVGHELAHHYRGHTGCVSTTGSGSKADLTPEELSRILSSAVPVFHQPQEVESDMWGMVNLLEAGHNRQGGAWTEEGALLNMDFFARLRRRGGQDIFRTFFSTHPLPQLRTPIIRNTARQWRPGWRPTTTPGVDSGGFQVPTPIGNIPLPIPLPVAPPGSGSKNQ